MDVAGIEPALLPLMDQIYSLVQHNQQLPHILKKWTVERIELSFVGCKPTVFPLDDTLALPIELSGIMEGALINI